MNTVNNLDEHTSRCVGCGQEPVTSSGGHLHTKDKKIIYAGWCANNSSCCFLTDAKPIQGCDSPEGCYGFYDEKKHGPLEWEWGD